MAEEDKPVLGNRTRITNSKYRHSATIIDDEDISISKELDDEAKDLQKDIRALPRTNFVCESCNHYFFRDEAVNILKARLPKPPPKEEREQQPSRLWMLRRVRQQARAAHKRALARLRTTTPERLKASPVVGIRCPKCGGGARLIAQRPTGNLVISAPSTLKSNQCSNRYPYGQPWCEKCGGVAYSDAENIARGNLNEVALAGVRAEAKRKWDRLNPPRKMESGEHIPSQFKREAFDLSAPRPEKAVTFEDFVAEGARALSEAIKRYRGESNGLNAYARKYVAGALAEAAADSRNRSGLKMKSRLQRFIRAHPFWRSDWIQEEFPQYTLERIEHEQELCYAAWAPASYVDDNGDRDEINDAYKEYEYPAQATLPVYHADKWRGCECGPISEGSRNALAGWSLVSPELRRLKNKLNLSTADLREMPEHKLAMMVRALPEPRLRNLKVLAGRQQLRNTDWWTVSRSDRVYGSLWNDRVEAEYKKRDLALLQHMGRNGFANWQVNRKTTCLPLEKEPASNLIGQFSTA
jgi:hypothetical protein